MTPRGAVVQLVRISACHAGDRGFESRPLRHLFSTVFSPPPLAAKENTADDNNTTSAP